MNLTTRLLYSKATLTLFTRANCSLCETAKSIVSRVRSRQDVEYSEVDVMGKGNQQWKNLYEFDTPVLHVQRIQESSAGTQEPLKLMHRFSEAEVDALVKQVERK